MVETEYAQERLLQELLAEHTDLLAGDQIDSEEPRRWLLISREAHIPSEAISGGLSLDHLLLDQDAVPTLVEVKRSSDTRIRREVVAQMLDYATNAVLDLRIERVREQFEKQCDMSDIDAEEKLTTFLGEETAPEEFWEMAKTNLQAGKIRMLFVADKIPSDLRRIVEFLNSQMDPAEVLAVEVKQYVADGLKVLVPRLIGQTMEASRKKSGKRSLSDTQLAYLDFYSDVAERIREKLPIGSSRSMAKSYYSLPTGLKGVHFEWSFNGKPRSSFAVGLHFETGDRAINRRWFDEIAKEKDAIEKATGETLIFLPEWTNAGWAKLYIETNGRDITDDLKEWAVSKMVAVYNLLKPKVEMLR